MTTLSYNGISVELLDQTKSNSTEDERVKWTTRLAAISRGKKESANPTKRFGALMKEAEGKRPSRPFEFLPVVLSTGDMDNLGISTERQVFKITNFSYIDFKEEKIYTNMRALINAGCIYNNIPFNEKNESFAAFRITAPMFVWAQVVTHTKLSTETQSDRVSEETEYWLPDDLFERIKDGKNKNIVDSYFLAYNDDISNRDGFIKWMTEYAPQKTIQNFLKDIGYKREIFSRAPYYFKMKKFVITGYVVDDDAWPHFLRERNAYMHDGGPKNWTQPETQSVARMIRSLIEENFDINIKINTVEIRDDVIYNNFKEAYIKFRDNLALAKISLENFAKYITYNDDSFLYDGHNTDAADKKDSFLPILLHDYNIIVNEFYKRTNAKLKLTYISSAREYLSSEYGFYADITIDSNLSTLKQQKEI